MHRIEHIYASKECCAVTPNEVANVNVVSVNPPGYGCSDLGIGKIKFRGPKVLFRCENFRVCLLKFGSIFQELDFVRGLRLERLLSSVQACLRDTLCRVRTRQRGLSATNCHGVRGLLNSEQQVAGLDRALLPI